VQERENLRSLTAEGVERGYKGVGVESTHVKWVT
jgi:hypothetical protein